MSNDLQEQANSSQYSYLVFACILVTGMALAVCSSRPEQIAIAQNMSMYQNTSMFPDQISGTYSYPSAGFEITLPKGWSGPAMFADIGNVMIGPNASATWPGALMVITIAPLNITQGVMADYNVTSYQDLVMKTAYCIVAPLSYVEMSGIGASQYFSDCEKAAASAGITLNETSGMPLKSKTYLFTTANNELISIAFSGISATDYDKNLPMFEESIKTIKIDHPTDPKSILSALKPVPLE